LKDAAVAEGRGLVLTYMVQRMDEQELIRLGKARESARALAASCCDSPAFSAALSQFENDAVVLGKGLGRAELNLEKDVPVPASEAKLQETRTLLQTSFEAWLQARHQPRLAALNQGLTAFVESATSLGRLDGWTPACEELITALGNDVRALLDQRPLEGARLPFVGLATPEDSGEVVAVSASTPAIPLSMPDEQVTFGMGLNLEFEHERTTYRLAEVYIETPPARLLEELPGMIAAEVANRVLGISNDVKWLDGRLNRHARQRALRERRLAEHGQMLQLYHGMSRETVDDLLKNVA
jgi:hypothetical protein